MPQILKVILTAAACFGVAAPFVLASINSVARPASPALAPRPQAPAYQDFIQHPNAAAQEIDRLARKSGGDITLLAPTEQDWLASVTGGHGALMLQRKARLLHLKTPNFAN